VSGRAIPRAWAALLAGAALAGIALVATGRLGQTDLRVIATPAPAFLVLATGVAALELLRRGQARAFALAVLTLVPLGLAGFMVPIWTSVFGDGESPHARWIPTTAAWTIAALLATTARLVGRTLVPVLVLAAGGAAVATFMIWADATPDSLIKALASLAIASGAAWLVGAALARR
jgi:hypothetical protein